jgi:hypothetical protein
MFYFRFIADTPYCGTENTDYRKFEERPTDTELDEMAEEFGRLNAESYEYLLTGWNDENFEDPDALIAALDGYYTDSTGTWEEITEEEYEEENKND